MLDFAHTPDALLKSIKALNLTYNNNISLVFGCGGDRDFKKRPLNGKNSKFIVKKFILLMIILEMKIQKK